MAETQRQRPTPRRRSTASGAAHSQPAEQTPEDSLATGSEKRLSLLARIFIGVIAALFFLGLIIPDASFSTSENRSLQTLPLPTIANVSSGRFQESFTEYVDDQFPFRDLWVSIQVSISTLMGSVESNDVYLGADGYLIQDFQNPTKETATQAIIDFARTHPDLSTYALIAPTAVDILSDKLPSTAAPDDQAAYLNSVDMQLEDAGVKVIRVRDIFLEHKDEGIYYKSDHHWTTYGAYLAFRQACEVMDLDPDLVSYTAAKVTDSFEGALKSRSAYFTAPADSIEVYLPDGEHLNYLVTYVDEQRKVASPYRESALDEKDKYQVFFGGNHPLITIESLSQNDKVLLVIKDSYANSFIPFLAEEYAKVIVVDPRYYFEDLNQLISSEGVNDVLFLYNATTYAEDSSLASLIDSANADDSGATDATAAHVAFEAASDPTDAAADAVIEGES